MTKDYRPARPVLALLAIALLVPGPAGAADGIIQPGDFVATSVGCCTLNFVYDGAPAIGGTGVFIGTAAHCVEKVGDSVENIDGDVFGRVAFIGNEDQTEGDYAFIEVLPGFVSRVNPEVKGHSGYPSGVTSPQETNRNDTIQLSGYGMGFDLTRTTQESRFALMGSDDDSLYDVTGPLIFGDSGGPLVHVDSGQALGIVSRLCFGTCTEVGPTVQGILRRAAERGFTVTLRAA